MTVDTMDLFPVAPQSYRVRKLWAVDERGQTSRSFDVELDLTWLTVSHRSAQVDMGLI
jgi:hypothetical protein